MVVIPMKIVGHPLLSQLGSDGDHALKLFLLKRHVTILCSTHPKKVTSSTAIHPVYPFGGRGSLNYGDAANHGASLPNLEA
jgi:hypothetical protein